MVSRTRSARPHTASPLAPATSTRVRQIWHDRRVRRPSKTIDRQLWREARRRLGRTSNEWARSLGREGLQATATFLICIVVLSSGAVVVALTWTRTEVAAVAVSVGVVALGCGIAIIFIALASGLALKSRFSVGGIAVGVALSALAVLVAALLLQGFSWTVRLPAVWVMLVVAVAVAGFLLSAQVEKPLVRGFSLCGLVILGLLLITIGRNERMNSAAQAARTDYLQLFRIYSDAEAPTPVAGALVAELCYLARDEECGDVPGSVEPVRPQAEAGLSDDLPDWSLDACLQGWTYRAFVRWAQDASIDRRVAATTALARCELGAFDPGAIAEAGGEEESASGIGAEAPADAAEAEQLAAVEMQTRAAMDARAAVGEPVWGQRSVPHLLDTFAAGADGILSSLSGPTEFAEFRFSGATWLVLLAFTLLWYRRLEIRAGSHGLGPVEIVYDDVARPDTSKHRNASESGAGRDGSPAPVPTGLAVFKQAVVQNVPEPGAVPGAQALAPVGDLIASTDVPNRWMATGLVDAVRTILATRSGYTVMYSAYQESSQAGSTYVVFIRVRDTQNGAQVAAMRFESEYLAEAAQMAGYWVAGWIISRSRYVPEWAVWSEREAHSFYDLQWRQGDDLPLQAHGLVDPNRIQAPVNALVLAQRAYAYQISPRKRDRPYSRGPYLLNALEDFARAAYHKPRYPVARYRRAVALSSLMDEGVDIDKVFLPRGSGEGTDSPSTSRLLHLFRDLLGYERHRDGSGRHDEQDAELDGWIGQALSWTDEDGTPKRQREFPPDMRRAMLGLAFAWLVEAERSARAGRLAWLRPSERRFWEDLKRSGIKTDWTMLVRVSREIVKVRLATIDRDWSGVHPMPADIVDRALEPDSHWQISYNIACYHSLLTAAARHEHEESCREGASAGADAVKGKEDLHRKETFHRKEAFRWLERCLDRRYSGQLVREWIDRDPDLAAVRSTTGATKPTTPLSMCGSYFYWSCMVGEWVDWTGPAAGGPSPDGTTTVDKVGADPRPGADDDGAAWLRWRLRVPSMPVLIRFGDRSSAVKRMQQQLNEVGHADPRLEDDGRFGDKTQQAVKDFQFRRDLRVTGSPDLTMLALLETLWEEWSYSTPVTREAAPAALAPPPQPALPAGAS